MALHLKPTLNINGEARIEQAIANGGLGKIKYLAIGRGSYHPTGAEAGLADEIARVEIEATRSTDEGVELVATITAPSDEDVWELGFLLEDGTPFAIHSEDPAQQYPDLDPVTGLQRLDESQTPLTRAGKKLAYLREGVDFPIRLVINIDVYGPGKITVVTSPLNEAYTGLDARLTDVESTRGLPGFPTRVAAIAVDGAALLPASALTIHVRGHTVEGVGGAFYRRVPAEPAHDGKLQDAGGDWWELNEFRATPQMFGAVGDGATDDASALRAVAAYCSGAMRELSIETPHLVTAEGYAALTVDAPLRVRCGPGGALVHSGSMAASAFPTTRPMSPCTPTISTISARARTPPTACAASSTMRARACRPACW